MAITSIKTGSSFTNLVKYNDFLAGNPSYVPPSFESIATVTAAGGEVGLTFSSIPSTYQHLQIRGILRKTGTAFGTTALGLRLNSDTGANYARHGLQGNGSSASAEGVDNQTLITVGYCAVPDNASSNIYGSTIIDIHDYKSTTKNKTVRAFSGGDTNGAGLVSLASGLWMSTSAINSVTLTLALDSTTFVAGSTFSLYGIK